MLSCEPDWRRGGRSGEDGFDTGSTELAHDAFKPREIVLALLVFAQAPGEFAHADDVHARCSHQFDIAVPKSFGIFRGAAVRINPLFRMVVSAKIHSSGSACRLFPDIRRSHGLCNPKKANCSAYQRRVSLDGDSTPEKSVIERTALSANNHAGSHI